MKSKEVIERVKEFANHFSTNGYPYNAYSSSSSQIKSELNIIEKDLEGLEFIIKNYGELISKRLEQKIKRLDDLIDTYENYRFSPIDSYKEEKNKLLKVKEWLNNE